MIEVEIRSFVSKEKFAQLYSLMQAEGEHMATDEQETHYFDVPQDIRIQQNNFSAKMIIKKGAVHDEAREEIEVKMPREQFSELQTFFAALHYQVRVKWFRTRHTFRWQGLTVMLDYTKGYGYIIELEKPGEPGDQAAVLAMLKEKLASLDVNQTERAVFEERFQHYQAHWPELVAADSTTTSRPE